MSLVFDLLSRDVSASKGFRDVGNAAEKAGKQTSAFGTLTSKAMGAAAGAVAGLALGSLFTGFIQDARESAKISRLTEAAIKSTGGAANVTAQQVNTLATALSNKTAIDDEAIQSASNLLLTFTRVRNEAGKGNDIFNQATASVLDMSTAMGTDANSAAVTLGKALNDPIKGLTALSRAGVQFTAQQKEQITTMVEAGDILGAQKIILAELSTQFGGAAEAAADPLSRLAVVAGNVGEEIGGFLLPAIEGLADFVVDDFIPAFREVVSVGSDVAGFIADIPGPVLAAIGALGGVALLKGPISTAFETIALRALYAKDAVVGATTSLGGLKKAGSGLMAFFGGPIGLAITGITVGLGFLVSALSDTEEATEGTVSAQNDLTDALQASKGAIDANVRAAAAKELQDQGVLDTLEDLGIATSTATDAVLGNGDALGSLGTQLQIAINSGTDFNGTITGEAQAAQAARDALFALAGQTEGSIASAGQLAAATAETGTAMATTAGQTSMAGEAMDEWLQSMQNAVEGFVEPVSIYKDLQSQMQQAAEERARVEAENLTGSAENWEDFVGNVEVSLTEYATALQAQLDNQMNWRTNLAQIAQWAGADVAKYLAEMGEEGVDLVAQMADGTTAGAQQMREQILREIQQGGDEWTAAMGNEMLVMERIGRDGSARTVQEVARQLGLGVGQVRDIARQYGIELASGVNPLLRGLGKPGIDISGAINSGGGRAMGGYITGPGGPTEDKAGLFALSHGEYVVKAASVAKYGKKMFDDLNIGRFATGGFVSSGDVPKPPSLSPYQWPISPPGQATNERAYGDTVDWVNANAIPVGLPPGAAGTPGQYQAMFAAVQAAFPSVRLHSGFRPGSITATGNLSYHALGRAIDITPDATIFNWIKSTYGSRIRELIFSPMGSNQVWNGQNHYYSEPTRGDHWGHIHFAMQNGGVINEPVIGRGMHSGASYSFGERGPETVTPGVGGGRGPIELSDSSIDRLARAMVRGAGAAVAYSNERMGINTRSALR